MCSVYKLSLFFKCWVCVFCLCPSDALELSHLINAALHSGQTTRVSFSSIAHLPVWSLGYNRTLSLLSAILGTLMTRVWREKSCQAQRLFTVQSLNQLRGRMSPWHSTLSPRSFLTSSDALPPLTEDVLVGLRTSSECSLHRQKTSIWISSSSLTAESSRAETCSASLSCLTVKQEVGCRCSYRMLKL